MADVEPSHPRGICAGTCGRTPAAARTACRRRTQTGGSAAASPLCRSGSAPRPALHAVHHGHDHMALNTMVANWHAILAIELRVAPRAHPRTMRGHAGQGPGWQSSMQSCLCPHSSCRPHVSPAGAGLQLLRFGAVLRCHAGTIVLQAVNVTLCCMMLAMHATCMSHHMSVLEATSWAGDRPACHSSTGTGRAPLLQGTRSGTWGSTMPRHAPCETPSCHQFFKLFKACKVSDQSKLHLVAAASAFKSASLIC